MLPQLGWIALGFIAGTLINERVNNAYEIKRTQEAEKVKEALKFMDNQAQKGKEWWNELKKEHEPFINELRKEYTEGLEKTYDQMKKAVVGHFEDRAGK